MYKNPQVRTPTPLGSPHQRVIITYPTFIQKYDFLQIREDVGAKVFMLGDEFVLSSSLILFRLLSTPTLFHRLAHAPFMQESFFPMSHKFLSPKFVQPIVDKFIALTHDHLEERANQYNGLNVALRDFIVPLMFQASGHAFFGQYCPIDDLFGPFKSFDNNFHLLLAGVPKMFVRTPVAALEELATILEENYLSKPIAMDDASDMVKEYDGMIRGAGFVSRSPTHRIPSRFDGPLSRKTETSLDSPSFSSGPSRRMRHSQRTGSSRSTSSDRMASNRSSGRSTRPSPAGTLPTQPSL